VRKLQKYGWPMKHTYIKTFENHTPECCTQACSYPNVLCIKANKLSQKCTVTECLFTVIKRGATQNVCRQWPCTVTSCMHLVPGSPVDPWSRHGPLQEIISWAHNENSRAWSSTRGKVLMSLGWSYELRGKRGWVTVSLCDKVTGVIHISSWQE